MPIYEYQCQKCGHHLEALQKLSDEPLRKCPDCGKQALKRLVSAARFRLAGSGWYETDFKSDQESKRNLVEGAEAGAKPETGGAEPADKSEAKVVDKDEAKPGAKPDVKPDAKPDAKPGTKTEANASGAGKASTAVSASRSSKSAAGRSKPAKPAGGKPTTSKTTTRTGRAASGSRTTRARGRR